MAQVFSLTVILFAPRSLSREAVKCPTSSELIVYNPESDKLARLWGKRWGENCIVHLSVPSRFSPQRSCVSHTLHQHRELSVSSVSDAHCHQWTRHSGHGATTRALAHLSLLPAQTKSQCHLPSSGSGAFLFMSVHLGHSLSELIVLFFYRFVRLFVFFKKRSFISCSATITSETESSCLPPAQYLAQTGLCTASLWPGC